MRKAILLALAVLLVMPAGAARRVTVAQLSETLAAATAQHRADEEIARQVGTLELSERLTPSTLDQFAAKLPLQPRTALALQLLADQSAFLDPPAAELPATAPPDAAAQLQLLTSARTYAVQTWGRLPNFFVSRVTTRFDDGAQVQHAGEFAVRLGLHLVNTSTRQITFRDGKEVLDPAPAAASTASVSAKPSDELGLRSWGEFGPALTVVLADMAGHKTTFSHWEQTAGGLVAVFHYAVPREASHYAVTYSYFDVKTIGRTQFGYSGRARTAQQVANIPRAKEVETYHETPGYKGMIAIDPATGAVLRITIEAELSSGDPLLRAATMIEYGPVTIGDRQFICPVRSLAISQIPGTLSGCGSGGAMTLNGAGDVTEWQSPTRACDHSPVLLINQTRFADYHRLGSTSRILTDGAVAETSAPGAVAPAPDSGSSPSSAIAPPAPAAPAAAAPPAETQATAAAPPALPASSAPAPPPAPPAEPVIPEISMTEANGVPDIPSNPSDASSAAGAFSIKVTTRLVDVGVVAYDKKGHPVTDLKAEDLELYDNGRKQEIRYFSPATIPAPPPASVSTAPVAASPSPEVTPDRTFSNRAPDPVSVSAPSPAPQSGATILLIDESHIAWSDMNYARSQMMKFLGTRAPSDRIGLYSMSGRGFRVLVEATTDHAVLAARLKSFTPTAQSVSDAQDEETRNRQQFNEVHNAADLNSVNGNHTEVPDAAQPVDPQLLTMGGNPARASLIILAQVARHLSSIPGRKSLIWVSSDNVFADWQDQQVGIDKHPNDSKNYAVRAQEAMNDAHTAVYPFDVSQLEGGAITADIQHRNVELTQAASDNAATAASAGGPSQGGGRNMQPGRITAEMSQDLHPIQGPIRDVAAATGGRTIRRSGDLAGALAGIVDDGHATYQLSFYPQGPADDQYHTIAVKLTGRRGLTLRYRTGYLFAKEPVTLKERFHQAVWKPLDTTEIAVTADVAPISSGASVKLNIAAADLGLEQQAGRWMDKLDIFFIQRDDAGLHAHVEGQTLGMRLKSSTYQNILPKGVPFEHAVQLQPGMSSLRVLVVDENSGRMGSVTIPFEAMKTNP
ncbi:MAG TPA: VWA domain-containing protein [Terracidiphilus sp.]|nr:VWA domain-containing protein [Terracidiphilus sp.]